jgi:3-oxoacyl-[acyl-carrier-protein] synthase-1
MVTAVGFNAPATCAALRARIRNVREANVWDPENGVYLAAGKVELPQWWVGVGKLADLVAPAILECLTAAQPVHPSEIPLLVGLSAADRPFRLDGVDARILGEIERRLGFRIHPASRIVPRDHVSVVVSLREAGEIIAHGQAPCVVVAAVDSLLQHDLKTYYLSRRRLLTPSNSNGFSLGEAGSALLVSAVGTHPAGELRVSGMGLSHEAATVESEQPMRAEGLTNAIRDALSEAGLTIHELQYRITDLNGEHYKFKEMTLAMMRFERKPKPKLFDLWHPIEYIGDVGAAIGPIVLGLALDASRKGYGNGPGILCTLSNDNGERAALVVNYVPGGERR